MVTYPPERPPMVFIPTCFVFGLSVDVKNKASSHLGSRTFPARTHTGHVLRTSRWGSHRARQDVTGAHCFVCV